MMRSSAFRVDLEDRAQLLTAFPRILIFAGEVTERAGDALIFGPSGLDVPRYSTLVTLDHSGGQVSMTRLKDTTLTLRSQSNVTQIVDDLESRELVRRIASKEDRRVSLVEITDKGRELVQEVNQRYYRVMEEYLSQFPTNSLREAVYVLIKWIWQSGDAAGISHMKPTPEPFDE
jgi:DNA-binding MarR family transcriptional regulator